MPDRPTIHLLYARAWHVAERILDVLSDRHDSRFLPLIDWWSRCDDEKHWHLRRDHDIRMERIERG